MRRTLAERIAAFEASDVYPVVTAEFCAGRDPAAVAEAVLAGGAKVIQIREKTMPDGAFLKLLRRVRLIADRYGALLIAEELGLEPADFWYAGDTGTDMRCASAAGMETIGVLWGYRPREELIASGARELAADPVELTDLVRRP